MMSKLHILSDSDSDIEMPAPLSERLLSRLHHQRKPRDILAETSTEKEVSWPLRPQNEELHESLSVKTSFPKYVDVDSENAQLGQIRESSSERKEQSKKQKEQRSRQLGEKRQIKEYENAKKKTLQEVQKSIRPGEAIKHMTVMLDPAVLKDSAGAHILDTLQKHDICYEIQSQVLPGIISFWREVTEVTDKAPLCLETEKKEVVEDDILLIVPAETFISLVHNFKQVQSGLTSGNLTLKEHVLRIQNCLEGRNVTLIVKDVAKYYRENRQNKYSNQSKGNESKGRKRKQPTAVDNSVSQIDVEEALIDAQLATGCNVRFVTTDTEMAQTVLQYTKAVADAPFKRERLNNGLSMYIEGTDTVKIAKDGHGVLQAWRQQLLQFRNVKAEVANAIMSQYKSPLQLWKAYQKCSSEQEAELLLQDIVIRRGVGVMATSRRIGKELSRRLYLLFTSTSPEVILK